MLVVFAHSNTGSTVATLHRGDGVVLQLPGYDRKYRVPHDLAHFATERTLEMSGGVFGSIAAGAVFSNMRVVSGRPRHDSVARSRLILDGCKQSLGLAELLAGMVHHAVETDIPDQAPVLVRKAWGSLRAGEPPWPDEVVAEATTLLSELVTDFEARGSVKVTWPDHLVAEVPQPKGVRRGRRGRT
ncbi:hypothetical protein Q0Z83_006560 [Actinoplanes sichuanensis]|uniref:Uncharacterized protein n=1 Tax=Actinoplanes sichuanensis TaxID=512349 RepID=A0ABW4AFJ4_9ACTN|nr:hypothetical protein [Actinoplanes sichuanensis]BEL02465.1 hypothetical protein Q0Z83_006560 [Actinoplanes sichuanensis]